jgi:hypothetical protein
LEANTANQSSLIINKSMHSPPPNDVIISSISGVNADNYVSQSTATHFEPNTVNSHTNDNSMSSFIITDPNTDYYDNNHGPFK